MEPIVAFRCDSIRGELKVPVVLDGFGHSPKMELSGAVIAPKSSKDCQGLSRPNERSIHLAVRFRVIGF